MKKSAHVLFGILAIALLLGGSAFADDTYLVAYYSNANTANAPEGTLRFTNTGATVAAGVAQPLNANIYVFDDTEEIQECCSCQVSPDGLLSESVNQQLTASNLLHTKLTVGVIKIVVSTGTPDPTNVTSIAHGMAGWITQPQVLPTGQFATTQSALWQSALTAAELSALTSSCLNVQTLGNGTGRGTCGCSKEGKDF
jgi:hypothetical protein